LALYCLTSFVKTFLFSPANQLISSSSFSFPFALGIAGSIRVGHLLGGNKPLDAERAARTVLVLTSLGCALLAALFLLTRHYIGAAFTDDRGVVSKVANLVPIAALFQLSDGIQSAIAGVLRGMGRQVRTKVE